jgi:lysophospholipase L1-like esterase
VVRGRALSEDTVVTSLRFVALGDSYTIGTSVAEAERWPNLLVARLAAAAAPGEPPLELVANLGVNGFATADVIARELPRLDALRPEFVSLLIGVNDVVRGVPRAEYEANAAAILDALLTRLPANRIVTVATPDYTVTPAGADYGDPLRRSLEVLGCNAILRALARQRGIAWADIFELSRRAGGMPGMVARDGLHPSGIQYDLWVDLIEPVVRGMLASREA